MKAKDQVGPDHQALHILERSKGHGSSQGNVLIIWSEWLKRIIHILILESFSSDESKNRIIHVLILEIQNIRHMSDCYM